MFKTVFLVILCLLLTDVTVNRAEVSKSIIAAVSRGANSLGHFGSTLMDPPGQ